MRHTFFLFGIVLLLAVTASAQSNSTQPLLLTTPTLSLSSALAPAPVAPFSISPGTLATPAGGTSPTAAASSPQGVQGVFVTYSWQAYIGYTFFRFYVFPGTQENQNGFNYSMVYYLKDWVGLDGEFAATRGYLHNQCSWFIFGGGGPRFRWSAPRNLELWGHVLFGYSHFSPQTAFGTKQAFAFTAGGGVDFNVRHSRLAYRIGADMVGSRFFNTYQYSPKFFAGIVFKF